MQEPEDLLILGDGPGATDLWRAGVGHGLRVAQVVPRAVKAPAADPCGWPWPGDAAGSAAPMIPDSPAVLTGRCYLAGGGRLVILADGRTVERRPRHLALAPRARAVLPSWWQIPPAGLPGDRRAAAERDSGRVVIIGGGHTGVELAAEWADGRRDVVLVEAAGTILPGWERDQSALMQAALIDRGVTVLSGWRAVAVNIADRAVSVRVRRGGGVADRDEPADLVLPALGWRPALAGLGLERTRALADRDGFLQVDSRLRTAEPGLSALGVAVALPLSRAVTRLQAEIVAADVAGRDPAPLRYGLIPRMVHGPVSLLAAGQTAASAVERGHRIVCGQAGDVRSWVRCVRDADTGTALGVQAAGVEAAALADHVLGLLSSGVPVAGERELPQELAEAWRRANAAEVAGG